MNIRDHCEHLREKFLQLEAELRAVINATGSNGEMFVNAAAALLRLEDSRARLGEVIRHHDMAQGAMSVAPIGSETHPLPTTADAQVGSPYTPSVPGAAPPIEPMPVSPTPAPPQAQRPHDVPSAADWENLEHMHAAPVAMHPHNAPEMEPQPLDRPADVPPTNTEVIEHEKVAEAAHEGHHETLPPSHEDKEKEKDVNAYE